jgi:hypothetical protein
LERPAYGATTVPACLDAFGGLVTSRRNSSLHHISGFEPIDSCFDCRIPAHRPEFDPHIFTGGVEKCQVREKTTAFFASIVNPILLLQSLFHTT